MVVFTEGVARGGEDDLAQFGLVTFEDVTGLDDPRAGEAHSPIDGLFEWNAGDAPPGSDLIGADDTLVFEPSLPLGYGTMVRVTLRGEEEEATGLLSDRATFRGGRLADTKIYLLEVESIPDLSVVSTQPSADEDAAPLNTPVMVRFSEAVDCATLTRGVDNETFGVTFAATDPLAPGAPVPGSFLPDCVEGVALLTFVPSPDLKYSRDIEVTLSDQVTGLRGRDANPHSTSPQGRLANGHRLTFSTLDPPPLEVRSVMGSAGGATLLRDVDGEPEGVEIRFSEGVRRYVGAGDPNDPGDPAPLLARLVIDDVTGLDEGALAAGLSNGVMDGDLVWNADDHDWRDENAQVGADDTVWFFPEAGWPWGTRLRVTLKGQEDVAGDANPVWLESDRATARGGALPQDESHFLEVERLPDLLVTKVLPGADSVGIPLDHPIEIHFSQGVDCASVASGLTVAFAASDPEAPGLPIEGQLTCSDGDTTAKFTPEAPIKYSRDVLVELSSEVRDLRAITDPAHLLADPLQGHLRTGWSGGYRTIDPPPLQVRAVQGSQGGALLARNVGGDPSGEAPEAVVVNFSEGVRRYGGGEEGRLALLERLVVEDITGAAAGERGEAVPGSFTWNAPDLEWADEDALVGADHTVVFAPDAPWAWGARLQVALEGRLGADGAPNAVRLESDRATARGGYLPESERHLLEVESLPDLVVVMMRPGAEATGVPLDQPIELSFSEGVDCASVASGLEVRFATNDPETPDTPVAGALACEDGDETVVFTPDVPIKYSRDVLVDLSSEVRGIRAVNAHPEADPLQGHLRDGWAGGYRTIDPPPLQVRSVKGREGRTILARDVGEDPSSEEPEAIVVRFSEGVRRYYDAGGGEDHAALLERLVVEDITADAGGADGGVVVDGSLAWNAPDREWADEERLIGADHTLVFTPATPWLWGTELRVTLNGLLDDTGAPNTRWLESDRATARGGRLDGTEQRALSVAALSDLVVVSMSPGDGAERIPLDQPITLEFSEGVDCASVETGLTVSFAGTDPELPGVSIPGQLECLDGETEIVFTPNPPLKYSRDVLVELSSEVRGLRAVNAHPEADPLQGRLRDGWAGGYRTIDPPPLMVLTVQGSTGSAVLRRDLDEDPESVVPEGLLIRFSEGVRRYFDSEGEEILLAMLDRLVVEDITGLDESQLESGMSNGVIPGGLVWNAPDLEWRDEGALIGADDSVIFTPHAPWQWGTRLRVTLKGYEVEDAPPVHVWLESDRATTRGGYLPTTERHILEVEQLADLTVVSVSPGANEQNIPLAQPITITFSEGVECASVATGLTVRFAESDDEAPGELIAGELICSDGETTAVFTPDDPIEYSRDVMIALESEVRSLSAINVNGYGDPLQGHLRGGWTGSYSTLDPPPLGITVVASESGEQPMLRDDALVVVFTEPVAQESAVLGTTVLVEDVTGLPDPGHAPAHGPIPGSVQWTSGDVLRFSADTAQFTYGTRLRLTLRGEADPSTPAIHSERATALGGRLPQDFVVVMGIERLPELYVRHTSPGHLAASVPHTTDSLEVTFARPPSCASINGATSTVSYDDGVFETDPLDGGGVIEGAWSCLTDDATVTFTAAEPFGWGRRILVTLSSEIVDARAEGAAVNELDDAQGRLIPEYRFGFGTEHIRRLQILATNAGGTVGFARSRNIIVAFDREVDCARVTSETFFINRGLEEDPANRLEATLHCDGEAAETVELAPVDDTDDLRCDGFGLCYDTAYTFTLVGGAEGICVPEKDARDPSDDGCLPSPSATYSFRTEQVPQLAATLYPPHNTDFISTLERPTVTFSNSIVQATVTEDLPPSHPLSPEPDGVVPNICLVQGRNETDCESPDAVPLAGYEFSEADRVVTVIPATALDPESFYTLVVSTDVEDVTGVRLSSFHTSSFKTASAGFLAGVVVHNQDDVNNLHLTALFGQDVNVASLHEGTFYLTHKDEFGATALLPATVTVGSRTAAVCDPATTGNLNCDKATLVPDLMALFACGPLAAEHTADDGVLSSGSRIFAADSYSFTTADRGKYVYVESGHNIANNGSFRIDAVSAGKALLDGTGFATEEHLSWSLTLTSNALPGNSLMTAHLSPVIRSADGTANVTPSPGHREFLQQFITGGETLLEGVTYSNEAVGPNQLSNADEVPVNAWFDLHLKQPVDSETLSTHTIYLADGRGRDGQVMSDTRLFSVTTPGTFVVGRDEGKRIAIRGSGVTDGVYRIASVWNDQMVALIMSDTFTSDATQLHWERRSMDYTLQATNGGSRVRIQPSSALPHHADYRGRHASVVEGTNVVSLDPTRSHFRFRSERDLGRHLTLTGSALGNTRRRRITAILPDDKQVVVDGPAFAATESDLSWAIKGESDYHELVLVGRSTTAPENYIADINGDPLAGMRRFRFTTSPETLVWPTPASGHALHRLMSPSVLFSRGIRFASIDENTTFFSQAGERVPAMIGYSPQRDDTVLLTPLPALRAGVEATLTVTEGVRDFRGNPVNAVVHDFGAVASTPEIEELTPTGMPHVTPTGGIIAGRRIFRLAWPAAPGGRNLVIPATIHQDSTRLLQREELGTGGTVFAGGGLFEIPSPGVFLAGRDEGRVVRLAGSTSGNDGYYLIDEVLDPTVVALATTFEAGEAALGWELLAPIDYEVAYMSGDDGSSAVDLVPTQSMQAGKTVRLTLDGAKIASKYQVALDAVAEHDYTVEAVAPELLEVLGDRVAGPALSLEAATDVVPDTAIVLVFDKAIARDSISHATVLLHDDLGGLVRFAHTVLDNRVVITPAAPLRHPLSPYALTVTTGVTDEAGTPLAALQQVDFSVDDTPPQLLATSPIHGAGGVSVAHVLSATFDKRMDPLSLFGATMWREGTFTVAFDLPPACNAGLHDELFGCVTLEPCGRVVRFAPQHPDHLIDEQEFTAAISGLVTDRAGNPLDGGTYAFNFNTLGGDSAGPVALCAELPLVAADRLADIHLSKPVTEASLLAETVVIFHADTGDQVTGVVSLEAGGTVVRFTADDDFMPFTTYGITLFADPEDSEGNPLYEPLQLFFSIVP